MSLLSIRWFDGRTMHLAIGDNESIIAITHMIENRKEYFKVCSCEGHTFSQQDLGLGGFQFWLDPGEQFK